jgi:GLPGLI family protein
MTGDQSSINSGTPVKQKEIGRAVMEFFYDYLYLSDTTNIESEHKDLMILQTGDGVSKFSSYRTMQVDSLVSVSTPGQIVANPDRYVGGETFAVYKNYPDNKFTNVDKISTDWFLYEEDIPVHEWNIDSDSVKEIAGYKCRRAECDFRGRKYIVWYSGEIPVAGGPWKFGGLPGLIMEAGDSKGHYRFTLSGINSNAARSITIPDVQYNRTTRDKYYSARHRFDIDPFGYMSSVSGVNVIMTTPGGNPDHEAMKPRTLKYDYIERDYKR